MIDLISFKGEMPIIDPKKLPMGNAVTARNCVLSSGSLEASKGLGSAVHTFTSTANETLLRYPYGNGWMSFSEDVDLVRGPIANDEWDRVYWTDGNYPKYSTSDQGGSSSLRLGIPTPAAALIAGELTGAPEDGAIEVNCAYICTYVSKYGEEGPPSFASNIVTRQDGSTIPLTNLPQQVSGEYDIDFIRIYRTESGGIYNHVVDLSIGTTTYDDSTFSEALGSDCPSLDWLPPNNNMKGLTYLGNGVLAGFFGSTLCFSEPYYPHAWPIAYQLAFKDDVVGIGLSASGLVVTTNNEPWLVSGSHPSSMGQLPLDSPYACISKRSMVDMGDYVLYASNDGLVAAAGTDTKLVSSSIIGSTDFKALNPETWKAFRFNDRYFVLHNTGCLSFSPGEGFKHFDVVAEAAYFDKQESELYLLLSDKTVCKWADGAELDAIWKSGILTVPPRVALTCARVDAEGDCIFYLYLDGSLVLSYPVSNPNSFRLPSGYFREAQIQIETQGIIHSVSLAQSPKDLK